MSADDVIQALTDAGVATFNAFKCDDPYSLPTREWVAGDFHSGFRSFLQMFGCTEYIPTARDCDDFANAAALYASILHSHTATGARLDTALLFGVFSYVKDSGEAHRLCFTIVREDDQHIVLFYEPQTPTGGYPLVVLSDNEKESCEFSNF